MLKMNKKKRIINFEQKKPLMKQLIKALSLSLSLSLSSIFNIHQLKAGEVHSSNITLTIPMIWFQDQYFH